MAFQVIHIVSVANKYSSAIMKKIIVKSDHLIVMCCKGYLFIDM